MHRAVEGLPAGFGGGTPVGVGIDIEDVARWRDPDLNWPPLFTPEEWEYCQTRSDPGRHLAGFWCAKEAVFKAVSARAGFTLRDISLDHRADGSLRVRIRGVDDALCDRILLSVAHARDAAAAIAVFVAG